MGPSLTIFVSKAWNCYASVPDKGVWSAIEVPLQKIGANLRASEKMVLNLFARADITQLRLFKPVESSAATNIRQEFEAFLNQNGFSAFGQLPIGVMSAQLSEPGVVAAGKTVSISIEGAFTPIPWEALFGGSNGELTQSTVVFRRVSTEHREHYCPSGLRALVGKFGASLESAQNWAGFSIGDPPPDVCAKAEEKHAEPLPQDRKVRVLYRGETWDQLMKENAPAGVMILLAPCKENGCLELHGSLSCVPADANKMAREGKKHPMIFGIFPVADKGEPSNGEVAANWAEFAARVGAYLGVSTYGVHCRCEAAGLAQNISFGAFRKKDYQFLADFMTSIREIAAERGTCHWQHLIMATFDPLIPTQKGEQRMTSAKEIIKALGRGVEKLGGALAAPLSFALSLYEGQLDEERARRIVTLVNHGQQDSVRKVLEGVFEAQEGVKNEIRLLLLETLTVLVESMVQHRTMDVPESIADEIQGKLPEVGKYADQLESLLKDKSNLVNTARPFLEELYELDMDGFLNRLKEANFPLSGMPKDASVDDLITSFLSKAVGQPNSIVSAAFASFFRTNRGTKIFKDLAEGFGG